MESHEFTNAMQQTGKLLPVYVKSRVPAALKTWQTDMENALSTAGLAIIMHHTDDLENYQRSEVNLIHKLYGMLLHPDGPLRNNRVLLKQVKDIVATRPKMHLHGARLYAQMCDGLRFVPAPKELKPLCAMEFHRSFMTSADVR